MPNGGEMRVNEKPHTVSGCIRFTWLRRVANQGWEDIRLFQVFIIRQISSTVIPALSNSSSISTG